MYCGSVYFLVLNRRMPLHLRNIVDVYRLLATGTYCQLNELTLERVIIGQAKSNQLIGFSEEVLAKIDRVIKDERTRRDSLVANYQEHAKRFTIDPHILQMCAEWKSTQADRDKEKEEETMAARKAMKAEKAKKAIKAKQDRARDRLIAAEAKAIKKKQAWCAKENRLLGKRLCRVEPSDWAAQLFAPPEPGDDSDDECEYVEVSSDDESSDDESSDDEF